MNFGATAIDAKAWKDIWGCGQGIGAIDAIDSTEMRVDRLVEEYRAAATRLGGLSAHVVS